MSIVRPSTSVPAGAPNDQMATTPLTPIVGIRPYMDGIHPDRVPTVRSYRLREGIVVAALVIIAACGSDPPPRVTSPPEVSTLNPAPSTEPSTTGPSTSLLADGQSGSARSDGRQIHYEVHGQGAPLVLVHGWAASIRYNWEITGWLQALQPVRQVIAIDIRGHGDSDKPHDQAAYGYAAMASDVIAVMDHLGVERADYAGYSLGAFIGAHLMGHDADRFTSFTLMGIGDEDAASLALAPRIADALRAPSADEVADPEARGYRMLVDLDPRNDREALALAALEMWPQGYPIQVAGPGLADVDVPVLIINGTDDPYAATDDKFAATVPGAELIEIPGANHLGVLLDPRFRDTMIRFLTSR